MQVVKIVKRQWRTPVAKASQGAFARRSDRTRTTLHLSSLGRPEPMPAEERAGRSR